MDTKFLQSLRENLQRQQQNLSDWLQRTPAAKKQIHLGPSDEKAAQAHLQTIEVALAKADDRTLGRCEVCHDYIETDRLEMDFTTHVCIDHYSAEQKRQLEADLALSHKVQKALLPQQLPSIPGLRIAAFIQPAEVVGGDYFDFFRFRDGAHGWAIADVMGKGLPASMLMASMQAALRILVPEHESPAEVVRRLNTLFCHNVHLIKFVTLFLARYDPQTRLLEYCNAGHHPPLLLRHDKAVQWLKPTGAAIGLTENFTFGMNAVRLDDGDVLLFYTDGVTEARNLAEEEFGEERLVELAKANVHASAQAMLEALRSALNQFTGAVPHDDITILTGKVAAAA
jgi:sigma-B regulation protein RsbU (phosphoserine phosphatase)